MLVEVGRAHARVPRAVVGDALGHLHEAVVQHRAGGVDGREARAVAVGALERARLAVLLARAAAPLRLAALLFAEAVEEDR